MKYIIQIAGVILFLLSFSSLNSQVLFESAKGIKIGTTNKTDNGIIRFTGSDFQGRMSGSWHSFFTPGPQGATGPQGPAGTNGLNGLNGIDGADGQSGLHCWDLNNNGVNDPSEDTNGDGIFNTSDCNAGGTGFWTANGTDIYNNNTSGVGIGVTSTSSKLDVNGTSRFRGASYSSYFNHSSAQNTYIRGGKTTSKVIIGDVGGPVVLGSNSLPTPGGYRLYVDGKILAEELKVALSNSSDWSDDAFYRLPSLKQMEESISDNSHLFGMPSADSLVETGYTVTGMDSKLLAQIEWQWMHLISMNKENKELKAEVKELKEVVEKLILKIEEIK